MRINRELRPWGKAGPGRSLGGRLRGVLLPENGRRSFVNHCLEPRSKRRDRAELQANVRHFELSRKRIAARMRTCQCMSHFVYNLRSRPLVRDLAARFAARSRLITADQIWSPAVHTGPGRGTPFLKLIYLRPTGKAHVLVENPIIVLESAAVPFGTNVKAQAIMQWSSACCIISHHNIIKKFHTLHCYAPPRGIVLFIVLLRLAAQVQL